jgi:hypothetical protein
MNHLHRIIINITVIISISSSIYGENSQYPYSSNRIPPYYVEQYEARSTYDDGEWTSAFIGAMLLGGASGFLCRQFEKIVLNDTFPLRLLNILIWGHFEDKLMDNVSGDLKNQKIKHSPHMMKRVAWLSSWISYLLGDLPS